MVIGKKTPFGYENRREDGLNVTERRVYEAMISLGLEPEPQYEIGYITVDFAFPDVCLVVEINGPTHEHEEQQYSDKKRIYFLNYNGWSRASYNAKTAYEKPLDVAKRIKKRYESLGGTTKQVDPRNSLNFWKKRKH